MNQPKINLVTLTYVFVCFGCPHIQAPTCIYVYILVCTRISFTLGSTLGYAVDCAHLLHLRHGGNADDGKDCNSGTGLKILIFYAFYIGSTSKKVFIFMYKYICVWNKKSLKWMILKKKNFSSKGKVSIFQENSLKIVSIGYPCKNVTIYLAHSFVSEHSKHFSLFWEKNSFFSGWGGGRSHLPVRMRVFFYVPP